jgi:hypothetical protein
MATTPQGLTQDQINQIIAAGRGNTVNLNGTIYQGSYADTGSGETFQEGALQDIYAYTPEQNKVGGSYTQYDPTGAYSRTGNQQAVSNSLTPFILGSAALFGGLGGGFESLFGGPAAGNGAFLGEGVPSGIGAWDAAFTNAGGVFNPAFALGADGLVGSALPAATALTTGGTAAGTTAANAATTGLTTDQIIKLANAGINVAGLVGLTNAVTNTGGNNTMTPTGFTGGMNTGGGYSPDYFNKVQSSYNALLPSMPRDVATPLQDWYSSGFNPGGGSTGYTTGGGMMTSGFNQPVTTVTNPVTNVKANVAGTPTYANLSKTSTPTQVASAYADFIKNAGGNTAANRKAATDYLTKLGLTQDQIGTSYNAYLNTLPAAGNTYDKLNAKATPDNIAQAYSAFIANAGGNTEANRQRAITYLKDIGLSEGQIGQAYNTYTSGLVASGNTYDKLNVNATPQNIAQAYSSFVGGAGGDTAANQQTAINYLKDIGLSDAQIGQAYNTYLAGTNTGGGGGGMLSAGESMTGTVAAEEPSYTDLAASSSPQSIAQAYADFVSASGGDTPENQRAAIDYLTNLGVPQDTIGAAYGLFKGA